MRSGGPLQAAQRPLGPCSSTPEPDPKPSPTALQSGRRNRLKPPFSWATRGLKILKFDAFKRGQGLRPLKPALLPISAFELDQRLSW